MKKRIIAAAVMAAVVSGISGIASYGQSKSFKLGQWTEIESSILKELNRSYVDSLPIDRIMRTGINAMLENLDPYTIYIPEEENEDLQMMLSKTYGGIGAVIFKEKDGNVIINEPYYGSPAWKNGLRCGDEILSIDGTPTRGLETKESSDRMKGKPGTTVNFKVMKAIGGDTVDVAIVRERIHIPDVEYVGMLDDTTGYIKQTGFTDNVADAVKNGYHELAKQGMKRLVLDLRGNGGGLMNEAIRIVSLFVPKGGKRTFGKGLVQTVRPVAYNGQLKVTTAKYYTPSGRCVQAIDYSHRNEDGSVGHIPDSLTHEFRTAKGRIVRDGGGITPDVELDAPSYSRIVYSLVLNGIIDRYAIRYAKQHESIPALEDFHFTDEDFEDFVRFAEGQEFDYRSGAETLFDQMKEELEEDGLEESMKEEVAALEKAIKMDKEDFIRLKKDEIIPFIEEEIAVRYYFQEAGIQVRLRYDTQLKQALESPMVEI